MSERGSRGAWRRALAIACLVPAIGAGCAHYPATAPLGPAPPPARYVFDQLASAADADEIFICVALSGGGTRAAAFAYGALQKLRRTTMVAPRSGRRVNLLDEVDCLSSVSGGSFTAAYFALHGGDRLLQDFRPRFLDRNIQGALTRSALNPLAWPRLLSPWFSRIDLAAELYDRTVFDGRTYGDLLGHRRRPYLIVNATEMDSGDRFVFTQDEFDLLGSDLAAYPLARAVAASSAFPFLLSPLTVTNHPQPAWWKEPPQLRNATRDYQSNRRAWRWSRDRLAHLDKLSNPFVHVMDGGLADNLGMRAIIHEIFTPTGFIARRINTGRIAKLLLLTVDAKNGDRGALNRDESPPGLASVAFKTATVAMDNFNFETIEHAAELRRELAQGQRVVRECQQLLDRHCAGAPRLPTLPAPVEVFVADITLDTVADPARRAALLDFPTSFSLTPAQVDALIAAADELLTNNVGFRRFLGMTP